MKLRCIESYSDSYKVGEEYEVIEQLENDRFIIPYLNDIVDTMNVPLNGQLWRFEIAKENKGMKEFKVGQKVKIREWDDMAKEFRNKGGYIETPFLAFVSDMKVFCGADVSIKQIYANGNYTYIMFNGWRITPEMCELIEDVKEESKNELNFIEAINKAKDGDLFKIVSEPLDEFNEVIELEAKYLHGDLFILKSSDSLDVIDNSLSTIYTLEAISQMKFTKLEKELTLDDFEVGEEFKVEDIEGRFIKTEVFGDMVVLRKVSFGIYIYKIEDLKKLKLIKIGENK